MIGDWRERWAARRADVAMMAIIAAFFSLFFWPALFGGQYPIAGDSLYYSYPLRKVAWETIRHGSLPLWTPLLLSGYPLLSMAQLGIGYPLTWGYLFLPGYIAEEVYVLAPYLLAPAFTYAYAREIGRSRIASLLAGLTFGYGGLMASSLANNGMLTNAMLWLPLILIAIERARRQRFAPYLLLATGAYAMSVLTGVGQGFLFTGVLATFYAGFICVSSLILEPGGGDDNSPLLTWKRLKPLAVVFGSILLAAGIGAFQILETMRAARRSVRSVLSYETFGEGSFTLQQAWRSFIAPLYHYIDVEPYVPLLAVALAVLGSVAAIRSAQRDRRVLFWLATAMVAVVLMLGSNTPFYHLVYYIPFLNRFRVPSRHAFEWTFAIGILSAYGWDAIRAAAPQIKNAVIEYQRREIIICLVLLSLSVIVGALWWKAANQPSPYGSEYATLLKESSYLWWKMGFTLLIFITTWQCWKIGARRWRHGLLIGVVILACFVEPLILIRLWWFPYAKPASRFSVVSPVTRFLQNYPPEQNRIYTRVGLFAEELPAQPQLDAHNLSALHGLQNVAGYEPLILERYSRALGNVGVDSIQPRSGAAPDLALFGRNSHILDILNTSFVVSYSNLSTMPEDEVFIEKEGIKFKTNNATVEVQPHTEVTLTSPPSEGDTLALVTSLANSITTADGEEVAIVRIVTSDGGVIERELRAGVDTAEWAHERHDVRAIVRHRLAAIFSRTPGDSMNSFPAYRYWARLPLGERVRVNRVEVVNPTGDVQLLISGATLYDSVNSSSIPLSNFDYERWQSVYDQNGVVILRNKRVRPRVWLVGEAEAVDGEEALRRIRGESKYSFDPQRTALLEISPRALPALPGVLSPNATARLVAYEPNHLAIETICDTPSVLVLSEIFYPGWEATIDGAKTPIHIADFLLRGLILSAGAHHIEMRYMAPAARNGALISLLTLLVICGIAIYARRSSAVKPA